MPKYNERGYLLENYKLFHISIPLNEEVDFHYHTFHKVVIPLKGTLSYMIEGRHYRLEPLDIALVGRGCIHKPETKESNERVLIYISSEYLRECSMPDCDLELSFKLASQHGNYVLRMSNAAKAKIGKLLSDIEESQNADEYGNKLLGDILVRQIMLELSRVSFKRQSFEVDTVYDEKTVQIMRYINENISENITVDSLAETFYISKFHLMRKFKEETGYTVHSYISNKRLLLAQQHINNGGSPTDACYKCGFRDYSAFSRAYKKLFGSSPRKK